MLFYKKADNVIRDIIGVKTVASNFFIDLTLP